MPSLVVLGARNLGGAVLQHFLNEGWQGAAVARSEETLEQVRARGALALQADAASPEELEAALARAREELGDLDLLVNAVSASRPPDEGGPFGGGPILDATLEGFRGWGGAVAEQAFVFLSCGARALRDAGGGTLVQVTGGSARRAMPNRGLWAAGTYALRALTQAAAQELRGEGIHVALLIVDATIESPKTAGYTRDAPRDALADQAELARAVEYLAGQSARGLTHELTVTPAGDRWIP
ncbi:MAG TPA: SDR family oxidoreductase [Solirubrobacteraceae bacterium]|nr:SDR family oxidoreductase [Solirubrobacteraceae bacterium]